MVLCFVSNGIRNNGGACVTDLKLTYATEIVEVPSTEILIPLFPALFKAS